MSVETRRLLERADIKLVRVFQGDFGFVRYGLGHGINPVNVLLPSLIV
jgi:hypothetical protein